MVHGNHGTICSCVGPMIDAQMKCKLFYCEKFMIIQITTHPVLAHLGLRLFLPSVYDALLVIRPSCNFRDGRVIKNYIANQAQYFIELAFNDGYLVGLIHLCCANYRSTYHGSFSIPSICKEQVAINHIGSIILGFAPVFLLIKSYTSSLVAELSGSLWLQALFRRIALGSTDGLCTFSCTFSLSFGPVIVPVGRIALGRILNVVGSSIDAYIDFSSSSQFCSYHFIVHPIFVDTMPFKLLTGFGMTILPDPRANQLHFSLAGQSAEENLLCIDALQSVVRFSWITGLTFLK